MNDDINTLAWSMVDDARFAEIMRGDSEKRQQLAAITPAPWAGKREWEDASHDCA